MFKLPLIELIERGLPEGFILIWACYILSGTKINYKRYFLSSIAIGCIGYLVRFLPVQLGVNVIINIFIMILLNIYINKIEFIKSIQKTIFVFILEFICEGINVFIIKYVFRADYNYIFSHSQLKTLWGLPSLALFITFILVINVILTIRTNKLNAKISAEVK